MSLSSACVSLSAVDTIVCLYCRALIAFSGLPATRYSDHLRHEHNILVPDELQFSISRTLKKTFEKKGGVARIKLKSFSEASRIHDPMNMVKLDENDGQYCSGDRTIIAEREDDVYEDEQNMLISINDQDENSFETEGQRILEDNQGQYSNKAEIKQEHTDAKESVDYKSGRDEHDGTLNEDDKEEKVSWPNISRLKITDCYVKMEKLQFRKLGIEPKTSHRKKRPSPAPTEEIPWYEFKSYRCLLCDVEVFLGSVDRHLSIIHDSDVTRYLMKFPGEDVSLSVPMWSCGICGEKTSWMHRTITHHLEVKHNHMNINEYYFVHVLRIKRENNEKETSVTSTANKDVVSKLSTNHTEIEINGDLTNPCEKSDQSKAAETDNNLEIPLKLPWYESSWHRCHICQEIFTFGYFVKTHVKRIHGMTQAKYFNQYKGASAKLVDWTCQICSKKIKWMNDSIYRHLHYGHRMSKMEYQHKYLETEDSVIGNVTDETLTGDEVLENDEIELPGVPELGDASYVINTKVLNPFHSPLPRNVKNEEFETDIEQEDAAII